MSNRRLALCFTMTAAAFSLAACGGPPVPSVGLSGASVAAPTKSSIATPGDIADLRNKVYTDNAPTSGPEYFSSSAYGVSASPRVATGSRLKRGGGYSKLGSSYVVKGKRYHPTVKQPPSQTGNASWYGKAFHGRMTANGELFDMNHLTAAHKTMPLPSYARVTNSANGRSVVVRVNDRGPFSNNRVIDLSKRAAEVLDYISAGTAKVKVEYVGPAPLHGNDDDYLWASIQAPGYGDGRIAVASAGPSAVTGPSVTTDDAFPPPPRPTARLSAYVQQRIDYAFQLPLSASTNWKKTQ